MSESQSDEIRKYAYEHYIEPIRKQGGKKAVVRAGNIHRDMGLRSRMPQVCSAIGADKFWQYYKLVPMERSGPANGANAIFVFGFQD